VYCPLIPPEFFDVIVVDECHRSIYSLWSQVLEYFDASIIGFTATPGGHTYAWFHQNVVSEYAHVEAVRDKVNVLFWVVQIRTDGPEKLRCTEQSASRSRGGLSFDRLLSLPRCASEMCKPCKSA
jgi:type I restriction enzyme R subunit